LQSVAYLHQRDLVHRDIRPENVMLEFPSQEGGTIKVKLIGFKEAVEMRGPSKPALKSQIPLKLYKSNQRHQPMSEPIGPVAQQAPEMISKSYAEKVDIWSIGIVIYYLLSGEYPFADTDVAKLKFSILNGRYNFKCNNLENDPT